MIIYQKLKLALFCCVMLLISCSENHVKEYFRTHDLTYPIDISGILTGNCKFINIDQVEVSSEESQRFVEDGIVFIRNYFQVGDVRSFMRGIDALVVNEPVLYRNESGKVGLMVRMTGYGRGDSLGKTALPVEWIGTEKRFWRVINFRYFFRNEDYRWQYGGQVYRDDE